MPGLKLQIAFLLLAAVAPLHADEKLRPQTLGELEVVERQAHHRVQTARVAYANYEAIRRDFPELKGLSNGEIDKWVLENFAFVSDRQQALRGVRTSEYAGPTGPESSREFGHPEGYDRASVAPARLGDKTLGLVDLKGSGSRNANKVFSQTKEFEEAMAEPDPAVRARKLNELRTSDHSDGMMSLGEAIAEITRQQAVQRLFDLHNQEHGTGFETVENYFVIDLGIELLKDHGQTIPAAILGRQAHWRGDSLLAVPENTYSDNHGKRQATRFDSAIDFGGIFLRHPDLFSTFGTPPEERRENAQESQPWKFAHDTAAFFRRAFTSDPGAARRAVEDHVAQMLSPLESKADRRTEAQKRENYLFQALASRAPEARAAALPHVMALPKDVIKRRAPSVFEIKGYPQTTITPFYKAVMEDPRFAEDTAFRSRLTKLAVRFRGMNGDEGMVNLEGFRNLDGKTDNRALLLLVDALGHPKPNVRNEALTRLKKFEPQRILRVLDRIFDLPFPQSVIGPLATHLLEKLPPGPQRESLIQRCLDYNHPQENPHLVIAAGLEQIASRHDATTLARIDALLRNRNVGVQMAAVEALMKQPYAEVEKRSGFLSEQVSDESSLAFLKGWLNHPKANSKSPAVKATLGDLYGRRPGTYTGQEALRIAIATDQVDTDRIMEGLLLTTSHHFLSLAQEPLDRLPLAERSAFISAKLDAGERRREFAFLLKQMLGPSGFPPGSPERRVFADRLLESTEVDWATDVHPAALAARVMEGPPIEWERLISYISSNNDSLRQGAVRELLNRDTDFVWSKLDEVLLLPFPQSVRGVIAKEMQDRLQAGSDRYYELHEKVFASSNLKSELALPPLFAKLVKDPHPRALEFLIKCALHENDKVRELVVKTLQQRDPHEILQVYDRILADGKPRTVIAPLTRFLLGEQGLDPRSPEFASVIARASAYSGTSPEYVQKVVDAAKADWDARKQNAERTRGPCPAITKIAP